MTKRPHRRRGATYGRFSGICQVAPVCTPPNRGLCFRGLTRIHNPNGISTVQWYSPDGASVHPHLIDASLGPPESATASRSVRPFLHSSCVREPYTLQQAAPFPLKSPFPRGLNPDPWFLWSTLILNPNGISVGSAVLHSSRTLQWVQKV